MENRPGNVYGAATNSECRDEESMGHCSIVPYLL